MSKPGTEPKKGAFLEAVAEGKGAKRFTIRVIQAGPSANGNVYPAAVLREAVPLFKDARVFAKSDEEHLAGKGKDVRNLIGRLTEARFVEAGEAGGEIQAELQLLEPEGPIAVKLREAWDGGMTGLFGFSIDALAQARRVTRQGRAFREATRFTKVSSVDLVVEPGAGGAIVNLIEAASPGGPDAQETAMRDRLIRLIEAKRPELLKDRQAEELSDEQLEALFTEALAKPAPAADPAKEKPGIGREELDKAVRLVEARSAMREAVRASALPDKAKERLVALFETAEDCAAETVREAIAEEAEYLAQFTESGKPKGLGASVQPGESRFEKVEQMLDAFFDPEHKDHRSAQSFKECYAEITGDRRVTGQLRHCEEGRFREALQSSSFSDVLGDAITRRLLADYRAKGQLDAWRELTGTPVPINDFRTQERTRFGGYGDLPGVGESDPYEALTSPDDEKATYAVSKRGGTESVTLEMIKNDDVGAIRRIPTRLSRSAKRTLSKFVFDFIRTNPLVYDGVALFHNDHGNLGSAALDGTSLAAGRMAMLKQSEPGSDEPLFIGPKSLLVPAELEEAAANLFRRSTNNDATFIQSLVLNIIPVWYWTDTNDWALAADPMDIPMIEIGFLDGQEEPEIFVQDSPTVGSMFTHDKLTWKIRHIYGGAVADFRGLYKGVVAGG